MAIDGYEYGLALEEADRAIQELEGQIEQCRKTLSQNGHCGDGYLPALIERALKERHKQGQDEANDDLNKMDGVFRELWGLFPDEQGYIVDVVRKHIALIKPFNFPDPRPGWYVLTGDGARCEDTGEWVPEGSQVWRGADGKTYKNYQGDGPLLK